MDHLSNRDWSIIDKLYQVYKHASTEVKKIYPILQDRKIIMFVVYPGTTFIYCFGEDAKQAMINSRGEIGFQVNKNPHCVIPVTALKDVTKTFEAAGYVPMVIDKIDLVSGDYKLFASGALAYDMGYYSMRQTKTSIGTYNFNMN
jgi:hypothetical protein